MVVAGRVGFVGSDLSRAQKEIANPPQPVVHLNFSFRQTLDSLIVKTVLSFPETSQSGHFLKLYAVVFENGLTTNVLDGENQGKYLPENFVVRKLLEMERSPEGGVLKAKANISLDFSWNQKHLGLAVFAQDQGTQKILDVRWIYPVMGE
jgi:hypothetical protein